MKSKIFSNLLLFLWIIIRISSVEADEVKKSCDVSETHYVCPLCGGTNVTDCMDCDGFINTGTI